MRYIIHLADIHIRTGSERREEYEKVFANLKTKIASLECLSEACIIVCGDIFHNKNRIDTNGIYLFRLFLNSIVNFDLPVVLISGNHDFQLDAPDQDMLHTVISCFDNPNIHYLSTTGHYRIGNLGLGYVALKDMQDEPPKFPAPSKECEFNVALFHGIVVNAKLSSFYNIPNTQRRVPLQWFKGYNAILLGDVHLQQFKRKPMWGYSGSLIQQTFGEPLNGHGFLLWDLRERTVSAHHIDNSWGRVALKYKKNWQLLSGERLEHACTQAWFPTQCLVKLYQSEKDHAQYAEINAILEKYGKKIVDISNRPNTEKVFENTAKSENPLQHYNTPDAWIEYLNSEIETEIVQGVDWQQWLYHPELVCDRSDTEYRNILTELQQRIADNMASAPHALTLLRMEWSWVLCFGPSSFDFTKVEGCIACLNAANGHGKTSFLEVICLGLFGQNLPGRKGQNINIHKPETEDAFISIEFQLGNVQYLLHRSYKSKTNVNLLKNLETGETRRTVDKWVKTNIGTYESFFQSCLLSQNNDGDFFQLKPEKQKSIFQASLGLSSLTLMNQLLHKAGNLYKNHIIPELEQYLRGQQEGLKIIPPTVPGMSDRITELENMNLGPPSRRCKTDLCKLLTKDEIPQDIEEQFAVCRSKMKTLPNIPEISEPSNNISLEDLEKELEYYKCQMNPEDTLDFAPLLKPPVDATTCRENLQKCEKEISLLEEREKCLVKSADALVHKLMHTPFTPPTYQRSDYEAWDDERNSAIQMARKRYETSNPDELTALKLIAVYPYNPECWACTSRRHESDLQELQTHIDRCGAVQSQEQFWKHELQNICRLEERNILQNELENCKKTLADTSQKLKECKSQFDVLTENVRQLDAYEKQQEMLESARGEVARLEKLRASLLKSRYLYLESLLKQKDVRREYEEWDVCHELKNLKDIAFLTEHALVENQKRQQNINVTIEKINVSRQKMNAINHIKMKLAAFNSWVHMHRVAPLIENSVNDIISWLTDNVRLHVEYDEGHYIWNISNSLSISKASGFQRFILALGMRITLANLGAGDCRARCTQLFLDEGFVSCDARNLSKVPQFLEGLLVHKYDSIILVSHLETLKDCASIKVPIERQDDISTILL